MISKLCIVAFVALACTSLVAAQSSKVSQWCTGAGYDLSGIAGQGITGAEGDTRYFMTICGLNYHKSECSNAGASFCAFNSTSDAYLYNIAKWTYDASPSPSYSKLDDGVSVIFKNGDKGSFPQVPIVEVRIHCSENKATNGTMTITKDLSQAPPLWTAHMYDQNACKRYTSPPMPEEPSKMWILALVLSLLLVIGIIGYFAYQKYREKQADKADYDLQKMNKEDNPINVEPVIL